MWLTGEREAMFLALRMEGGYNPRKWVTFRNWKRQRNIFSSVLPWKECSAASTLIVASEAFWTPSTQNCINWCCFKPLFSVIYYGNNRKLIYMLYLFFFFSICHSFFTILCVVFLLYRNVFCIVEFVPLFFNGLWILGLSYCKIILKLLYFILMLLSHYELWY